jgi:hypothetical protein
MSEYFEFPKWIFHPLSGLGEIVMDAEAELAKFEEWGVSKEEAEAADLPNPLSAKIEAAPAPEAPPAAEQASTATA